MTNKKLLKKIICGATICSIGIAAITLWKCKSSDENTEIDYIGNLKYQTRVASELDANMKIMEMFNQNDNEEISRLKPNDTNTIYVGISDEITGRAKENINKILEQYNKIFSYVNNAYQFETCSMAESYRYSRNDKTTINFHYKTLSEHVLGSMLTDYFYNSKKKRKNYNIHIKCNNIFKQTSFQ